MTRPCALAGTTLLLGLLSTPAQATPILEQTLIATGGDVVVTFVSDEAGYTSELFLDGAFGDELGTIFDSGTTATGTSMNLGTFAAGTELIFKLLVEQTGNIFYTGAGDANLDGVVHARMENASGQVLVGFEDLFGGGDLDYDDLVFAFSNVMPIDQPGGGAPGATTGAAGGGRDVGSDVGGVPGAAGTPGAGGGGVAGAGPVALAVDEPGTLVMLGSGLLMLGLATKRQTTGR